MGERFFRPLTMLEEREHAAARAVVWGFPRPVTRAEIEAGHWFEFGSDVLFWFEPVPGTTDAAVHLAVRPESRSRWPALRWHRVMLDLASGLGAERLHYAQIPGQGDEVRGYLDRLGWLEGGFGMYLPVPG